MYVCLHVCEHACMHAWMDVWMYGWMDVSMYACMHVCMYACMHVCMYVYIDVENQMSFPRPHPAAIGWPFPLDGFENGHWSSSPHKNRDDAHCLLDFIGCMDFSNHFQPHMSSLLLHQSPQKQPQPPIRDREKGLSHDLGPSAERVKTEDLFQRISIGAAARCHPGQREWPYFSMGNLKDLCEISSEKLQYLFRYPLIYPVIYPLIYPWVIPLIYPLINGRTSPQTMILTINPRGFLYIFPIRKPRHGCHFARSLSAASQSRLARSRPGCCNRKIGKVVIVAHLVN